MELKILKSQAGPAEQSFLFSREEVSSLRCVLPSCPVPTPPLSGPPVPTPTVPSPPVPTLLCCLHKSPLSIPAPGWPLLSGLLLPQAWQTAGCPAWHFLQGPDSASPTGVHT